MASWSTCEEPLINVGLLVILPYVTESADKPVKPLPSPANPTDELTLALNTKLLLEWSHVNVLSAPSIVIPAPFAADESAAPLAISKFLSSILRVDVLSCVCVPCTVRFPSTVTSSLFNVIAVLNDDVNDSIWPICWFIELVVVSTLSNLPSNDAVVVSTLSNLPSNDEVTVASVVLFPSSTSNLPS